MFAPDREFTSINITKVRNGFVLDLAGRQCSGAEFNPYVFPSLSEVFDFLVEQDYEITAE